MGLRPGLLLLGAVISALLGGFGQPVSCDATVAKVLSEAQESTSADDNQALDLDDDDDDDDEDAEVAAGVALQLLPPPALSRAFTPAVSFVIPSSFSQELFRPPRTLL